MAEIKILIQTSRNIGLDQAHRIIEEMDALSPCDRSAVIANLVIYCEAGRTKPLPP